MTYNAHLVLLPLSTNHKSGLPTIRPSGLEKILSQGKDRLCIASFTRRRSSPQKPGRNRL